MKTFILASLLVISVSASLLEEHGAKFRTFKLEYSKTYKNQVEEAERFTIFRDNIRSIEEHNALYEQGLASYKKGINQFSDLTPEEFKSFLTLHARPVVNATKYVKTGISVPNSIDWRTKGQVTAVKNQGQCGCCWAFSVTGSTEAAYYRKSGNLVSLSEQQLVDCSTSINDGCSGGFLDETFPYIEQYGLEAESSYPYTARDGSCHYNASKVVTKISSYVSTAQDESSLLEAVGSIGPVSVAIDASDLAYYASGIYSDRFCSPDSLNHGVLVVGYGSQNGENFWIVKNSWSASWGEQGYFRIKRGTNECGIAEDDVYPVIN